MQQWQPCQTAIDMWKNSLRWPSAASYCSWSLRSLCLFDWWCGCRDHTRERDLEKKDRSIWQKASLSFHDQFLQAYTDVHLKQQLLSLSLVISLGKQQTPPREASFSLHSPFLRPFCNIPFACSISSPLSLSRHTPM
jgi:hypothetical protein